MDHSQGVRATPARQYIDGSVLDFARQHFWTSPDLTAVLARLEARALANNGRAFDAAPALSDPRRSPAQRGGNASPIPLTSSAEQSTHETRSDAHALSLAASREPQADLERSLLWLARVERFSEDTALLAVRVATTARAVGRPRQALAVLDRVLAEPAGETTAVALALSARALADLGRRSRRGGLFSEAESIAKADRRIDATSAAMSAAWVQAHAAAAARHGGALDAATHHAEQGLALLSTISPELGAGHGLVPMLTYQLMHVRLAAGAGPQVLRRHVEPALATAVRADNAQELGWLAIATATRLYPYRSVAAEMLLREALAWGRRFGFDDVIESAAQELCLLVPPLEGVELVRLAQLHRERGARRLHRAQLILDEHVPVSRDTVAHLHERVAGLAAARQAEATARTNAAPLPSRPRTPPALDDTAIVEAVQPDRPRNAPSPQLPATRERSAKAPIESSSDPAATRPPNGNGRRHDPELAFGAVFGRDIGHDGGRGLGNDVGRELSRDRGANFVAPSSDTTSNESKDVTARDRDGGFSSRRENGSHRSSSPFSAASREVHPQRERAGDPATTAQLSAISEVDDFPVGATPINFADEPAPPGLAHVPGLVVTEGTGGRRRAPDSSGAHITPFRPAPDSPAAEGLSAQPATPAPDPNEQASSMRFAELLAEAMDAYRSDQPSAQPRHRKPDGGINGTAPAEPGDDSTAMHDLSPEPSYDEGLTRHDWRGDSWWYGSENDSR